MPVIAKKTINQPKMLMLSSSGLQLPGPRIPENATVLTMRISIPKARNPIIESKAADCGVIDRSLFMATARQGGYQ